MPKPEWALDPHSPLPLHTQFERHLRSRIESGLWKAGERIPAERDLMRLAGISRATVRQAINTLVQEGLLERAHGSGTFVRQRKFEQALDVAYSFSLQLRRAGFHLEDHLLERARVPCPPELSGPLQMAEGTTLIYIRRLRLLDGAPFMVNNTYVPYALCPALLSDPLADSLYQQLTERYGLPVLRAVDRFEAQQPERALASLLHLPAHAAVMFVRRVAWTSGDVVLHFSENFIRGDRCYFSVDLQGQPTALSVKPGADQP